MLNQLIMLNFFVYQSFVSFLIMVILFSIVLFYFFESYKDLIVDYLPEMVNTLPLWQFLFIGYSCGITIVFFNYNVFF